jgi:sodium transport system permease protein
MRWSVVRLIAAREARDQLRDRRTVFLILGLPLLMYPLFIGVGIVFFKAMGKELTVGVVGAEHLPKAPPDVSALMGGPGAAAQQMRAYPSLLNEDGQFAPRYAADAPGSTPLIVKQLQPTDDDQLRALLNERGADAIIVIEADTAGKLERDERPVLRVLGREGEENSNRAVQRTLDLLHRWADHVRDVRFARKGLPPNFDHPVELRDPDFGKTENKKATDKLRDMLVKVIPFLLVMWMLTGAIYPAIDMTAGEKERGTMETLLISPAERIEIVAGKFLATALFSFGTAMWNVLLMVVVLVALPLMPLTNTLGSLVSLPGLGACILAAIPLAMLFAALALTLGVFARSTKEGNYYMVPLFFVVLPLAYWTFAPGIELDGYTQWIPLANALLFQQRLMSMRPDPFPWQHVPAVFGTLALCVALALWGAVRQFHRESVLFRDAQVTGRKWSLFGRK